MSGIPLFHIDAFTGQAFSGNPAAVCLLEDERDAAWMQAVAAEMNLSETAFVRRLDDGFDLRWFTPAIEVDLCGHATLASAHALWTTGNVLPNDPIRFHTRSGILTARAMYHKNIGIRYSGDLIELDFPATPATDCGPSDGLLDALRVTVTPTFIGKTAFDKFLVVDSPNVVRSLRPDFRKLAGIPTRGVIVTAASDDPRFDFISRFFAPAAGIDEDPVTGSAHCCLGPYWSQRLVKTSLVGYQASARGGIVHVRVVQDRVILGGQAVTVFSGHLLCG